MTELMWLELSALVASRFYLWYIVREADRTRDHQDEMIGWSRSSR